MDNYKNW
jgi:hypothetical protein